MSEPVYKKVDESKTPWGTIIWLCLFFPVGLWKMHKQKNFTPKVRWIVTGAFALIFLVQYNSNYDKYRTVATSNPSTQQFTRKISESFDRTKVKFEHLSKQHKGGQVEVYFVHDNIEEMYRQTQLCVNSYLKDHKSAYCYGFSSVKDFQTAKVSKRGMEHLCYRAYSGQAISGNKSGMKANDVYDNECSRR